MSQIIRPPVPETEDEEDQHRHPLWRRFREMIRRNRKRESKEWEEYKRREREMFGDDEV